MRNIASFLIFSFTLLATNVLIGQGRIDSSYANTYYKGKMELFNKLKPPSNAIVFLGNSITERGPWNELLQGQLVVNRGIGGDNTFGILARLDELVQGKPKVIFLLIGINDIGRGLPIDVIAQNYWKIIKTLQAGTPKTRICIQSVLPLNDSLLTFKYLQNKQDSIKKLNVAIQTIAANHKLQYIDLYPLFADERGQLKEQYSLDGIHLKPIAYLDWVQYLKRKKYL
jgi:lysophospholipase L1-like esterase